MKYHKNQPKRNFLIELRNECPFFLWLNIACLIKLITCIQTSFQSYSIETLDQVIQLL